MRHAEGKLDFGIARHRLHDDFRLVFERIIGGLVQNNSYALEKRRNSARGIYHKAKSFVGFVTKIFREFRETLVHICRATAVIGFQPVNGAVGAHVEKVAFLAVCRNGVWLLDVLMRRIIFGNRCGKRVEAIKFQQVGVISVARFSTSVSRLRINSTTVQSSTPFDGFVPSSVSSDVNTPAAVP